jgi:hypothetical protein
VDDTSINFGKIMNKLYAKFMNIRRSIRRHGLLVYLKRLLRNYREKIYKTHESTVYRRVIENPVELLDAKVDLDVQAYSEKQKQLLYEFLTSYEKKDIVDSFFKQGMKPMLGFVDNKLISVSWYTTKPLYLDSVELTVDYGKHASYIERTRTHESMQGKGIAPAIRTRICSHLNNLGYKDIYVVVGDDNKASQAVAKKCLFKPYESIKLKKYFGIRRHYRYLINKN